MNVVVISSSPAVAAVAREAVQQQLWTVVGHWSNDDGVRQALQNEFPALTPSAAWDELLAFSGVQGVVVCGDGSEIVEAARQFSAKGLPLFVVLDTAAAPATQFGLTSVWHDNRAPVIPVLGTGLFTPALKALEEFTAAYGHRPVRIEFTCTLPVQSSTDGLTEEEIDRNFFHVAGVLRQLGGEFEEITSLRLGLRGDVAQQALITLAGETSADVSWTLARGPEPGCRLVLHGPNRESSSVQWSPEEQVAKDLGAEIRTAAEPAASGKGFQWPDLIRTGELAATARTSATRRRTIRMQLEEGTERAQFKSQMTALGCGVLMWAMFGSMLMLFSAVVLDPRDREYKTAAAHGFVVRDWEFSPDSNLLNPGGQEHVAQIARRWEESDTAVLIEAGTKLAPDAATRRAETVVEQLESTGLRNVASRVVSRELSGQLYERLLKFGWLVVFIPLVVFLLCQALIIAARGSNPAEKREPRMNTDEHG